MFCSSFVVSLSKAMSAGYYNEQTLSSLLSSHQIHYLNHLSSSSIDISLITGIAEFIYILVVKHKSTFALTILD